MSEKLESVDVLAGFGVVVVIEFMDGRRVEKANFCCPLLGLTMDIDSLDFFPTSLNFGCNLMEGGRDLGVTNTGSLSLSLYPGRLS